MEDALKMTLRNNVTQVAPIVKQMPPLVLAMDACRGIIQRRQEMDLIPVINAIMLVPLGAMLLEQGAVAILLARPVQVVLLINVLLAQWERG